VPEQGTDWFEIIRRFHDDLCTAGVNGGPCERGEPTASLRCRVGQALLHLNQNVRDHERHYLIPRICKRCEMGQELVRDATGRYCHRAHVGAYLHDCHAAAVHEMLVTSAIQVTS